MVDQVIKVKARKADPDTSELESELNSLVLKLHAKARLYHTTASSAPRSTSSA